MLYFFWIHWTSYSKQQLRQLQIQRICNNFFFPAKNTYFKRKNLDSFQKMYVRQLSSCQTIQYLMLTGSFESKSDLNELKKISNWCYESSFLNLFVIYLLFKATSSHLNNKNYLSKEFDESKYNYFLGNFKTFAINHG